MSFSAVTNFLLNQSGIAATQAAVGDVSDDAIINLANCVSARGNEIWVVAKKVGTPTAVQAKVHVYVNFNQDLISGWALYSSSDWLTLDRPVYLTDIPAAQVKLRVELDGAVGVGESFSIYEAHSASLRDM